MGCSPRKFAFDDYARDSNMLPMIKSAVFKVAHYRFKEGIDLLEELAGSRYITRVRI